jgi:hypothetical protein
MLGALDRLLASLMIAGARRTWPALRLVPSPWLRPLVAPTARRVRRSLMVPTLALVVVATAILVVGPWR